MEIEITPANASRLFNKLHERRPKSTFNPQPSAKDLEAYFSAIVARVPEDTTTTVNAQGGKKYDQGKPDYTLLPLKALEDTVKVLGFGAQKYGRDNWKKVERQRYLAAAYRHLVAIIGGEEFDEESGMPHAAHLTCCSLFIGELGRD